MSALIGYDHLVPPVYSNTTGAVSQGVLLDSAYEPVQTTSSVAGWRALGHVFRVDGDKMVGHDSYDGEAAERVGERVESLVRDHGKTDSASLFGWNKQTTICKYAANINGKERNA